MLENHLVKRVIQVFPEPYQNGDNRNSNVTVGKIENRAEEQTLSRAVGYNREIKHVHHLSVEQGGIAEPLSVEDAVNDVAQCTGGGKGNHRQITVSGTARDESVHIPYQYAYRNDAEDGEKQFVKPFDAESHSVVLHVAEQEERQHFAAFA